MVHVPEGGWSGKGKSKAKDILEMEVLVGAPGNAVFLQWLAYIRDEIARKPYDKGVYRTHKMRYIYETTGPRAMQRFFNLRRNQSVRDSMRIIIVNFSRARRS